MEIVGECPEEFIEEYIKRTQHYMAYAFGDNVELNLPMLSEADFGESYQEAKQKYGFEILCKIILTMLNDDCTIVLR